MITTVVTPSVVFEKLMGTNSFKSLAFGWVP